MKETIKQDNYKYLLHVGCKKHLLLNIQTNAKEIFFSNKNHASWGLKYKNTHLEFVSSLGQLDNGKIPYGHCACRNNFNSIEN